MKQVRVLRSNITLLGKKRRSGDYLETEKFFDLPPHVRNSLINSDTVEIITEGTATDDRDREVVAALQARVEKLERSVQALLTLTSTLSNKFKVIEQGNKEATNTKVSNPRMPKKGNSITFMADDKVIKGEVVSTSPTNKTLKVVDLEKTEWDISIDDVKEIGG